MPQRDIFRFENILKVKDIAIENVDENGRASIQHNKVARRKNIDGTTSYYSIYSVLRKVGAMTGLTMQPGRGGSAPASIDINI